MTAKTAQPVDVITFDQVTRRFTKDHTALNNVNFSIAHGEFVFIVGPSGAGKTSIMRMINREDRPTSGKVWVEGVNVVKLPPRKLPTLRRKVGVVFQDFKLLPKKNVFENIAFAMEVSGKTAANIKKVVPYIIKLVGLKGKEHSFPHQLSGGESQRAAIARALVHEPKILLADEPTGNLDQSNAWEIIQLLNQINSWGTTVVMATHNQDIVNALQKRVISVDRGEIIRDVAKGKYSET